MMEGVLQCPSLTWLATRRLSARRRRPAVAKAPARLETNKLLWSKRINDLLEARIAAQWVPEGEQLKHAVARGYGCSVCRRCGRQLLQGQILFAGPGRDQSEVGPYALPSDRIFFDGQQLHCAATFLQGSFLVAKGCIDQTENTKRRSVILLLLYHLLLLQPRGGKSFAGARFIVHGAREQALAKLAP